jgi:hypothetical protein
MPITKQKRINLFGGYPQPINMYIITTTNILHLLREKPALWCPQNIKKILNLGALVGHRMEEK